MKIQERLPRTCLLLVMTAGVDTALCGALFADGFESGDRGAWPATLP